MQLKLRLLIITIASLQLSLCAVIRESRATSRIDRFRNFLLSIPNVEPEKVNKFIDVFNNIASPNRRRQYEALLELLFYGTNISKDEQTELIPRDVTEEDLVKIERDLNNKLTSNRSQKIIQLFRNLGRENRGSEEEMNAVSELVVHAIPAALNIPDNCISVQTITDFQSEKIDVLPEEQKNKCSQQQQ